ncbi:MAG: hypothetical protein CL662_08000 [Bacteroidetes bacterium]|nr:hypothetical protein [Bacteroidota bacterium]HCI70877.1 hypothetical protein [Balneola sp.]|tara:strand:+ start:1677 stop:2222 length:546 start_codon:yes stop_codon:yes gene_type:complete
MLLAATSTAAQAQSFYVGLNHNHFLNTPSSKALGFELGTAVFSNKLHLNIGYVDYGLSTYQNSSYGVKGLLSKQNISTLRGELLVLNINPVNFFLISGIIRGESYVFAVQTFCSDVGVAVCNDTVYETQETSFRNYSGLGIGISTFVDFYVKSGVIFNSDHSLNLEFGFRAPLSKRSSKND